MTTWVGEESPWLALRCSPPPLRGLKRRPRNAPTLISEAEQAPQNTTPVLYLFIVRLARCEIFADSSLLGGHFYLRGLLFPRPPPEGPVPPPCPVGHPAPFLSFCGCAIMGLLLIKSRNVPSLSKGAFVCVHPNSCCSHSLACYVASRRFGIIEILLLTIAACTRTHYFLPP